MLGKYEVIASRVKDCVRWIELVSPPWWRYVSLLGRTRAPRRCSSPRSAWEPRTMGCMCARSRRDTLEWCPPAPLVSYTRSFCTRPWRELLKKIKRENAQSYYSLPKYPLVIHLNTFSHYWPYCSTIRASSSDLWLILLIGDLTFPTRKRHVTCCEALHPNLCTFLAGFSSLSLTLVPHVQGKLWPQAEWRQAPDLYRKPTRCERSRPTHESASGSNP